MTTDREEAEREPIDGELATSVVNPSHAFCPAEEPERIESSEESRMANYNDVLTTQRLIDIVAVLHERYETVRPEVASRRDSP